MAVITQEELKEVLSYDSANGEFTRINSRQKHLRSNPAGHVSSRGYVIISVKGKRYYAHRLAWLYFHKKFPLQQIDHINGNPADNRLCNLREVSNTVNHQNEAIAVNNTSGCIGVCSTTWGWLARVTVNGAVVHLGYFKQKSKAIAARLKASQQYGFHKNHGRSKL